MERRVSGITLEILGRLRLFLQKWLLHYIFFYDFSAEEHRGPPCPRRQIPERRVSLFVMQTCKRGRKQHRTRGLNVHDVGVDLAKPSKPTKHFVPLALIGKQQKVPQTGVRTFRIWSANNAVIVKVSNVVSLLMCTERFYWNTQKDFGLGRGLFGNLWKSAKKQSGVAKVYTLKYRYWCKKILWWKYWFNFFT